MNEDEKKLRILIDSLPEHVHLVQEYEINLKLASEHLRQLIDNIAKLQKKG